MLKERILFVVPPSFSHRTAEENIGIGYLASFLESRGHLATTLDASINRWGMEELLSQIQENLANTILLGISSYIYNLKEVAKIVQHVKRISCVPIVAGGFGPTFHPEKFLGIGCDYILRGEAELQLTSLVESFHRPITDGPQPNPHSNFVGMSPVRDLDDLPFPKRSTIRETTRQKNPVHVVTSRGCFGNCSFCSVSSFMKEMDIPKWRGRSIRNIADEIESLFCEYGVAHFKFVDDSFIEPPRDEKWAAEFAKELARRRLSISFRTQIRADRVTEGLAANLKSAGWMGTSVGIENFSPAALHRTEKRASVSDNLHALDVLERNGIYTQMGLILFDPKTSIRELQENLAVLSDLRWPVTKGIFSEMFAARGTTFSRRLNEDDQVGNLQYVVEDADAREVYDVLKRWQKMFGAISDRAANPISAPKILPVFGYREYHRISLRTYELGVCFLKEILEAIEKGEKKIDNLASCLIDRAAPNFLKIERQLVALDSHYGLSHQTIPNPFLSGENT